MPQQSKVLIAKIDMLWRAKKYELIHFLRNSNAIQLFTKNEFVTKKKH